MGDGEKQTYTLAEVAEHSDNQSLWVVIDSKVYDITKFMEEHPGGEEVLLKQAGGDATGAFEDVGHSKDARDMRGSYYIGDIEETDKSKDEENEDKEPLPESQPEAAQTGTNQNWVEEVLVVWLISIMTVAVAMAAAALRVYVYAYAF